VRATHIVANQNEKGSVTLTSCLLEVEDRVDLLILCLTSVPLSNVPRSGKGAYLLYRQNPGHRSACPRPAKAYSFTPSLIDPTVVFIMGFILLTISLSYGA